MFFVADILFSSLIVILWAFTFFMFDEIVLKGYFATKLRKRFNVEEIK
jgi:hypothetical protein